MVVSETKERILAVARELFQKQGYSATGITQILKIVGVPKGSLYHFFPGGKEELMLATIDKTMSDIQSYLDEVCLQNAPGVQRVKQILKDTLIDSQSNAVVPFALIALETAESNEAINQACQTAYTISLTVISKELIREGYDYQEAQSLARIIQCGIEGALVYGHTFKDSSYLQTTIVYLERLLSDTPSKR